MLHKRFQKKTFKKGIKALAMLAMMRLDMISAAVPCDKDDWNKPDIEDNGWWSNINNANNGEEHQIEQGSDGWYEFDVEKFITPQTLGCAPLEQCKITLADTKVHPIIIAGSFYDQTKLVEGTVLIEVNTAVTYTDKNAIMLCLDPINGEEVKSNQFKLFVYGTSLCSGPSGACEPTNVDSSLLSDCLKTHWQVSAIKNAEVLYLDDLNDGWSSNYPNRDNFMFTDSLGVYPTPCQDDPQYAVNFSFRETNEQPYADLSSTSIDQSTQVMSFDIGTKGKNFEWKFLLIKQGPMFAEQFSLENKIKSGDPLDCMPGYNYPVQSPTGWAGSDHSYSFTINGLQAKWTLPAMNTFQPNCTIAWMQIEDITPPITLPSTLISPNSWSQPQCVSACPTEMTFDLGLSTINLLHTFQFRYGTYSILNSPANDGTPESNAATASILVNSITNRFDFSLNPQCGASTPAINSWPVGFTQDQYFPTADVFVSVFFTPPGFSGVDPVCKPGAVQFVTGFDEALLQLAGTSPWYVSPIPTPTVHQYYTFKLQLYSPIAQFLPVDSSEYTLTWGCPPEVIDLASTSWLTGAGQDVSELVVNMDKSSNSTFTYTFTLPTFSGTRTSECKHTWTVDKPGGIYDACINIVTICDPSVNVIPLACNQIGLDITSLPTSTAESFTFDLRLLSRDNPALDSRYNIHTITVNAYCAPYLNTIAETVTGATHIVGTFSQNDASAQIQWAPFCEDAATCCQDAVYTIVETGYTPGTVVGPKIGPVQGLVTGASSPLPTNYFWVAVDTTETVQFTFTIRVDRQGVSKTSPSISITVDCLATETSLQTTISYVWQIGTPAATIVLDDFVCAPLLCCSAYTYTETIQSYDPSLSGVAVLVTPPALNGAQHEMTVDTSTLGNFVFTVTGTSALNPSLDTVDISVSIQCLGVTATDVNIINTPTFYQNTVGATLLLEPVNCSPSYCCSLSAITVQELIISFLPATVVPTSLITSVVHDLVSNKIVVSIDTSVETVFYFKIVHSISMFSVAAQSPTQKITIYNNCYDDVVTLVQTEPDNAERSSNSMPFSTRLLWQNDEDTHLNMSWAHSWQTDRVFSVASRFYSANNCPLTNFLISEIVDLNFTSLVNPSQYTANISSTGLMGFKDLNIFSNYQITVQAFNGFKWSSLTEALMIVQVYYLPPPPPPPEPVVVIEPVPVVNVTVPTFTPNFTVPVIPEPVIVVEEEEKSEPVPDQVRFFSKKKIELKPKKLVNKFNYFKDKDDKEKEVIKVDITKLKYPMLRITEINRKGNITIIFNQPLIIPGFVTRAIQGDKNMTSPMGRGPKNSSDNSIAFDDLESLNDIDVQRDVFDTFLLFSETKEDYSLYQYTLQLHEWTESGMIIQILFDNPQLISKTYDLDQIYFKVINTEMFTTRKQGLTPNTNRRKTVSPMGIPKQLPEGISEDAIRAAAASAFQSVIYGQLVAAFFIKSAIKKMWALFFFLQMYCANVIVQIDYPINVEITFEQFRLIVFFEILAPEPIMRALGIDLGDKSLSEIIFGSNQEDQSEMFQTDMQSHLTIMVICLIGFLLLAIVAIMTFKLSNKVMKFLVDSIKSFYWNNTIKSIYVAYLPQMVSILFSLRIILWKGEDTGMVSFCISMFLLFLLIVTPLLFYSFIVKNRFKVKGNKAMEAKYGELYYGLRMPFLEIYHDALFFYPSFLIRRFCFVAVVLGLDLLPELQLPAIHIVQVVNICWIGHSLPMVTDNLNKISIFNEIMLILCHFLQMYIHMVDDFYTQWNIGYALIAVPFIVVIVNVWFIVSEVFHEKRRIKILKSTGSKKASARTMLIALREDFKKRLDEQRIAVMMKKKASIMRELAEKKNQDDQNEAVQDKLIAQMREQKEKEQAIEDAQAKKAGKFVKKRTTQFDDPVYKKPFESDYLKGVSKHNGQARINILKLPIIDDKGLKKEKAFKMNKTEEDIKSAMKKAYKMKMIPPEPIHFDVYPSILAKTKHTRLNHKRIVENIEQNIIFREGDDALKFENERAERETLRKKQKGLNDDIQKKISKMRPNWNMGHIRDKIMKEDSCTLGGLEYELAFTIELVYVYDQAVGPQTDE